MGHVRVHTSTHTHLNITNRGWQVLRCAGWVCQLETRGLMCSCSLRTKAWDPGDSKVWFQSEGLQALDPRRVYVTVQKRSGRRNFLLLGLPTSLFYSDLLLIVRVSPTSGRANSFWFSLHFQMLIPSKTPSQKYLSTLYPSPVKT